MSNEIAATAPAGPTDTIAFSNVTVVRDQEGSMSVWVGSEKMLGVSAVQIQSGVMSLGMPMTRVRLAEDMPATPVREIKDNVIPFARFKAAQEHKNNSNTDGDLA